MDKKCCMCKYIFCNPEFDEMLDCELASELSGKQKCYYGNFENFEQENNAEIVEKHTEWWTIEKVCQQKGELLDEILCDKE